MMLTACLRWPLQAPKAHFCSWAQWAPKPIPCTRKTENCPTEPQSTNRVHICYRLLHFESSKCHSTAPMGLLGKKWWPATAHSSAFHTNPYCLAPEHCSSYPHYAYIKYIMLPRNWMKLGKNNWRSGIAAVGSRPDHCWFWQIKTAYILRCQEGGVWSYLPP